MYPVFLGAIAAVCNDTVAAASVLDADVWVADTLADCLDDVDPLLLVLVIVVLAGTGGASGGGLGVGPASLTDTLTP